MARSPRRAAITVVVVLVLAAGLVYTALWNDIDVTVSGTFRVATLTDRNDVKRIYARIYRQQSRWLDVPSGEFLVTKIDWRDNLRVHWPAKNCNFSALLAHPAGQVVGFIGKRFDSSVPGLIALALAEYPDIPSRNNRQGEKVFAGTVFSIDARAPRPTLTVLLQSSATLTTSQIRVGILFHCDDRMIDFQWLGRNV